MNERIGTSRSLGVLVAVLATALAGSALAGPLEDFYALEDKIVEAQDAFMLASHEHGDHEGHGHGKSAHETSDPRLEILKKMDALAQASVGKKDTATIAGGAFMWSWNLDLDLDGLVERFDHVVSHYADDELLDDMLSAVAEAGKVVGEPGAWITATRHLIKKTKRSETRLGAQFTLGQIQLAAKMLSESKASFVEVAKAGGKSEFADLAKGYIYEIDHLQIGMVAPDFTATKLDGTMVSLKSFRGKAVLLNFWATW